MSIAQLLDITLDIGMKLGPLPLADQRTVIGAVTARLASGKGSAASTENTADPPQRKRRPRPPAAERSRGRPRKTAAPSSTGKYPGNLTADIQKYIAGRPNGTTMEQLYTKFPAARHNDISNACRRGMATTKERASPWTILSDGKFCPGPGMPVVAAAGAQRRRGARTTPAATEAAEQQEAA